MYEANSIPLIHDKQMLLESVFQTVLVIGPNGMSQNQSMLLDFQHWILLMIKFDRDLLTICLDDSFSVIGNDIDAKMDNKQDQLFCLSIFPFSFQQRRTWLMKYIEMNYNILSGKFCRMII